MLPSAGGPINALIATSVVMNALITGILQVYSVVPEAYNTATSVVPEAYNTAASVVPEAYNTAASVVPRAALVIHSSTATGSPKSSPT